MVQIRLIVSKFNVNITASVQKSRNTILLLPHFIFRDCSILKGVTKPLYGDIRSVDRQLYDRLQ